MKLTESLTPLLFSAMLISVVLPASAHPPYEIVERELRDPVAGNLTLVKSYIDGIVFSDPVKLVVRDQRGVTVAETEYNRDLSIICRANRCAVFQYDGFFLLIPNHVWRLDAGTLVPDSSIWLWSLGMFMPYFEHWLGYLVAAGCFILPLAALKALAGLPAGGLRTGVLSVVSAISWLLLVPWLYFLVTLSELSLPRVAILIGAVVLVQVLLFGRERSERSSLEAAPN